MEDLEKKLKVMYTEDEIQNRIKEIAKKIDEDYKGKTVTIISVLKGAIFFTVDLVKKMKTPITLEVIQVSSYQGTQSTGNIIVKKGLDTSIEGKDVLIVEDIIDKCYIVFPVSYLRGSRNFIISAISRSRCDASTIASKEESGIRRTRPVELGNSMYSRRSRIAFCKVLSSIILRQTSICRSSPSDKSLQTWSNPT